MAFIESVLWARWAPQSYLRSLLSLKVKRISHHSVLRFFHTALNKLIIDAFLHICARACAAALTLVEEDGHVRLVHCLLHCQKNKKVQQNTNWCPDIKAKFTNNLLSATMQIQYIFCNSWLKRRHEIMTENKLHRKCTHCWHQIK